MRTPFNKAITTANNKGGNTLPTVGTYPGKADSMNKELKKVADAAATIEKANPETRAQYLKGIADAQEAQKTAAQAKEDAETEAAFNKACDDESHARDKEAFFKRQLDRLDYTPRMEEATYYGHVDAVDAVVKSAAADFRKIATKAMEMIVDAKEAYLATVAEADEVLTALDAAANVLQVKHRYKEYYVTGEGGVGTKLAYTTEDRNEWTRHAIRYKTTGKAYNLVNTDKTENGVKYNDITCAAWNAADRAEKAIKKG